MDKDSLSDDRTTARCEMMVDETCPEILPHCDGAKTVVHQNSVCVYDEETNQTKCVASTDSYTTITFPQTLSDTSIDAVSQPLSFFVGQSDGNLESVSVQSDKEHSRQKTKEKLIQKPQHQPRNGHSVKRQQKCSKVERKVTNSYKRLAVCLYILASMVVIATIVFWTLSFTSVYSTKRNVLPWSLTIAAICLMVTAIFWDVKSRKHQREMKEMHRRCRYGNEGEQRRPIYIGPDPLTLGLHRPKKGRL